MKKYLLILLVILTGLTLPSCRSKKEVTGGDLIVQEEVKWKNVSVPVKFELLEPQKFTMSGRATLVRGEYVYVSMRFLGFEVAQLYVTPTEADAVIKQGNRMWIQEPIGERLASLNIPFEVLQEAMLGEPAAISRLPQGLDLTFGGTRETPVLTLRIKAKNSSAMARMTMNLSEAQWDSPRPAEFTAPGSDYTKIGVKDLRKMLP